MKLKKSIRLLKSNSEILFKKYSLRGDGQIEKDQPIISFTADGLAKQGGLVDRLKGILSVYDIVKSNKMAEFKINFTSPFVLKEFLIPNKVDWIFKEELKYVFPKHKPIYFIDDFDEVKLISKLNTIKKGHRFDVYYNIDILRKQSNHAEKWHQLFWELFSLSPRLEKELNQFAIPKGACAIHIRFLNNFGDFTSYLPADSSFVKNVLSDNEKTALREKFEDALRKLLKEFQNLVLFSDSNYFMNNLSEDLRTKVIRIPGEIRQSEDKSETGFDAHKKTFIDFFLMAQCEKVIMLKSKETYNSSFSKHAALVGGKEFEIKSV